jgi:hypothetical protein
MVQSIPARDNAFANYLARSRCPVMRAVFACMTVIGGGGLCSHAASAAPPAAAAATATVDVRVVDAASGRPISDATVTVAGTPNTARHLEGAPYRLSGVPAGSASIMVRAPGYRTVTQLMTLAAGRTAEATVKLARSDEATELPTIGRVAAKGDDPVAGPTLHTTLGARDLERAGAFRLADALVTLPDLSATNATAGGGQTSQSSGPGSSIYMDIRGFGPIETMTEIDGHPIGQGVDLGFNFQDAPIFALRNVYVGYGSGATGIANYGEMGGVIDMQTLTPTGHPYVSALQGFGSYGRLLTQLQATGLTDNQKLGYAFAYGVEGSGGPISPQQIYSSAASWDQSSPEAAIRDTATYEITQNTTRRAVLGKLRYSVGPSSTLTLDAITNTAWADGTGNSDNIYRNYGPTLALGTELLAAKQPQDPCPTGTFTATNLFGIPNGYGRNGQPDGGITCQTPQQYAGFNTGWQGLGPHQTAERATDYDLRFDSQYRNQTITADAFTNSYYFNYDRLNLLPYFTTPGDTGFDTDQLVVNTGVSLVDRIATANNEVSIGMRELANSNRFRLTGSPVQSNWLDEQAVALEDRLRAGAHFTAQADLAWTHAEATSSAQIVPHALVAYEFSPSDRVRVSGGSNVVQPPGIWLDLPFEPTPLSQFVPTCSGVASIGGGPSLPLSPEHGTDGELTYSHLWGQDSQVTVAAYTAQLVDKLYNVVVPVSELPPGAVPASALAPYQQILDQVCGSSAPPLGVTENLNLGNVSARGLQALANVRLTRTLVLKADWSQESAILTSAPPSLLAANLSFIPGGQLPSIPLHKWFLGLDYTSRGGIELGVTGFHVSENNPADLPAYSYANLELGATVGPGRLRFIEYNMFNNQAGQASLIGQGYPLPLNSYAPANAYLPYVGAAATTAYVLAPRRFELYYQLLPLMTHSR